MTVLDVITKAIKLLGDTSLLAYLNGDNTNAKTYSSDKELLLTAYNQTVRSVSLYYPLSYEETLTPVNGAVKYQIFKYNPYKIKSVTRLDGGLLLEILPTEIKTDGEIKVNYYYYATANDYADEYCYLGVLSDVDVSYGVLAEYLIYKGRFEESALYFDKFANALSASSRSNKPSKMKAREWF